GALIHRKLVDAWGNLHHLPDNYAWRFLPYHLAECYEVEQLRRLLLDFEWMRRKLEATDITSLMADYNYLARENQECAIVQGALQLSAHVLAKDPAQLAGQLLGRLPTSDEALFQSLIGQAAQNEGATSQW